MSDLPKSQANAERITAAALQRYREFVSLRNRRLPTGVLGKHDEAARNTFIENTVLRIVQDSENLSSEDKIAAFLANRLERLLSEERRIRELVPSIEVSSAPPSDREAIMDRICTDDHIAIESIAEAFGIGEMMRAAYRILVRKNLAKASQERQP
jgi:hypothetical protein